MQAGVGLLVTDVMPIFMIIALDIVMTLCRGIVTSDVLVKGLSCGAIATKKLEGVNRDKGHDRVYTSLSPYSEGKAYV